MRADKKPHLKSDKKTAARGHKRGVVGYSKKTALLEEAITQMNTGKYGRSSAALKELLALDPLNMEARRLFATLHLRLGSLIPARQAFDSLISEAFERQDYWLAESLLREYLAAGPRCVPFLEKLGALFQEKGDALEAVVEYGKAIDILIEDPDTDNPQHAAQLYAKIRDLAPASPVAFRLASFFDAQTGELIDRPATVAHTEGEAAHSLDTLMAIADETAEPISEPSTGLMPWEQVEEHSTSSSQPAATDALQGSGNQTEPVPSSQFLDPVDTFQVDGLTSSPPSEINAEPVHQVLDADTMVAGHIPPAITPASSMAAEDVTIEPSGLELSSPLATDLVPLVSSQDPDLTRTPEAAGHDSISAPMPWEHVQESTINIPEHVADDLPPPPAESAEIQESTSRDQAASSESRDESVVVSPMSVDAASLPAVSPILEPSATALPSSSADMLSTPPLPEASKGGFSWDSVFDSAWKFGDKFSSSPPVQQVEKKAEVEAASQAPPIAPMPWDQVQETTVTIPPAEVEAIAEAAPVSLPILEDAAIVVPREIIGNDAPSEAVISPAPSVMGQDSFSITHPPAAPPSAEQEFSILGTDVGHGVDAGHQAEEESQLSSLVEPRTQTDQIQAESPVAVHEAANSILTVDVQPSELHGESKEEEVEAASIIADSVPDLARGVPVERAVGPLPDIEDRVEQAALPTEPAIQPAPMAYALSVSEPVSSAGVALQRPLNEEPLQLSDEEHHRAVSAEPLTEHLQPHPVVGTSAPTGSTETASCIPVPSTTQPGIELPSPSQDNSSHWSTGEVAVQTHRPTPKKRKRGVAPSTEATPVSLPVDEQVEHRPIVLRHEEHVLPEQAGSGEPVSQRVQEPDEWIRTSESIRFIEPRVPQSVESVPQIAQPEEGRPTVSSAAAAVDVLFESSGRMRRTETRERERVAEPRQRPRLRVKLARIRIAISLFVSSCFSTTRAMVISVAALFLLSGALTALGVGAVGLLWTIMEERPSSAFHSLTTIPQRTLSDPKKNGYVLALGFDASAGQDPFQVGYERKPDEKNTGLAAACMGGPSGDPRGGQTNASARVASGWFQGSDPVAQFKAHLDTIKGWTAQAETTLGRYNQWLKLPFEDWGYGQSLSPPCGSILFAHQLYLADGFVQSMDTAIDRLETDMEAWRMVLGQAKTLPVKTMALEAINNDIAVASGLLVKPDFDGRLLGRLTKMLRPLDQVELSIRWPMQSELVAASKTFAAQMKADRNEELPVHVVVASALPLPKQRRFNDYADYYEASYKAAGEGRHASLPKWGQYIRFPANTLADYLMNPIENIVGLEPLPAWDRYNGMVVDTDAHLRLASLQAWLRRGPQDADLLARIAKAGQSVYDPYTGLPMLVNLKKGVMYSVGHDGKDQDADPQTDIVVTIPMSQYFGISPRSTSSKFK